MNISSEHLNEIAERLRTNYPECEITQSENTMVIRLPMGSVQISGNQISFFIVDALLDEIEPDNMEDLYAEVESFILLLRDEEQKCTPTFATANTNAAKRCQRGLYVASALEMLMLFAYLLFDLSWIFLGAALLLPLAAVIPIRFIRLYSFHRDWICPHCGATLPLKTKEWIPQLKQMSNCPQCGELLLDKVLVEQLKEELSSENEEIEEPELISECKSEFPKRGGKRICTVCGILLLILTLFFGALMFVDIEQTAPAVTALNIMTLLATAIVSVVLMRCHTPEWESAGTPKIVVCEQKWLPVVGILMGILGLVFLAISFFLSAEIHVSLWGVALFAALGLLILWVGAWMLLARKNRALYIYHSSLVYVTSFGRKREFKCTQISNVRLTAADSIQFLNENGKKLFSIETNMVGADGVLEWIATQTFSVDTTKMLEKKVEQSTNVESTVSWREEYHTPLHNHLGAIRIGLVFVLLMFAAGCIVPFLLYLSTDFKISHAIYLTTFSSLPMLLYYIAFAPVLLLTDRPKGATDEWNSMHIKFPSGMVVLLALLNLCQVYYFWESNVLQIADTGRFVFLVMGVAAVLIALFWVRTPKRVRKGEAFSMAMLSLVALSFALAYGGNLAVSGSVEHYPAVVVERSKPTVEDEDAKRTLTILLDDGTTAELNVTERLYELEEAGTEFVVCQKESFLGIRMVRLHLPEGTDVSTLPQTDGTAP